LVTNNEEFKQDLVNYKNFIQDEKIMEYISESPNIDISVKISLSEGFEKLGM